MPNALQQSLPLRLYWAFGAVLLASIVAGLVLQEYLIFLAPVAMLIILAVLTNHQRVLYFMFALLPVTVERAVLPAGASIGLPGEPIVVGLFLVFVVLWAQDRALVPRSFLTHPLIIILLVHLAWMGVLHMFTLNFWVSLKFLVSKLWFVGTFTFFAALALRKRETFMKAMWPFLIVLTFATLIVIIHHAIEGFRFGAVNDVVVPFFRNHVNSAALFSISLPFAWFARKWYPSGTKQRNFLTFSILVLLTGIVFSYTRAAWVATLAAVGIYYLVRLRMLRWVSLAALVFAVGMVFYMAKDNRYLDYAPDFETTIYHGELGQHLEATIALQDVSSAERIYRWVAAFHMFMDDPWTGVGQGNFYPYYKRYTVESFRTYVSDNPEQSTVHNYYLLMLVEQGAPGFAIWLIMALMLLWWGERLYHRLKIQRDKQWAMAILLAASLTYIHLLASDLVEVDNIGGLFFLWLGLIVALDIQQRGRLPEPHA